MKSDTQPLAALCLRCERSGTIQSVLRWSLSGAVQPETGTPLSALVDAGSVAKAGFFLREIVDRGTAFDWQINVATRESIDTLAFSGVDLGDSLLVLAAGSSAFHSQNVLTRINSELSNLHRRVAQQNETLVEQRSRLESILESIEVAVIEVDPDGIVNFANGTLERALGIPVDRLHGTPLANTIRLTAEGEDLLAAIDSVDSVNSFEDAVLSSVSTGHSIPVSGVIAPVSGTHGEIVARVISLHDLTVWEQRKQMILSATLMQASRRITAGMSHSINNLMTIVLGNAYRLENPRGALPPDCGAAIDSIKVAAQRAASIAERMMYYTQDQIHRSNQQNLNAIVREFLADWEIPDNVTLESTIADDPALIRTDRAQIETMLFHLLQNAAEAIGTAGTIRVHTTIEVAATNPPSRRTWRLLVRDDGEGMDDETRANMFEPFFSTRFLGRGLGLAAVDGIVRMHDGKVNVVSAPGSGTTLDVGLPVE